MNRPEILVMTGTISVGETPYVEIKDSQERLLQYLCSLIAWIKLTSIKTIVFCENSNTTYDFRPLIEFAEAEGKRLEVLTFDGNQYSKKYGKGFGEGIIMEYVANHSQYFKESKSFYKITGRLFIENFETIKEIHSYSNNVFKLPGCYLKGYKRWWDPRNIRYKCRMYLFSICSRGFKSPEYINNNVATFFYKSSTDFFLSRLLYSYKKVNENIPYWLEHAYFDNLKKEDFQVMLEDPRVVGRSGSNGFLINDLDYTSAINGIAKAILKI